MKLIDIRKVDSGSEVAWRIDVKIVVLFSGLLLFVGQLCQGFSRCIVVVTERCGFLVLCRFGI